MYTDSSPLQEDDERTNRFLTTPNGENQRAASQPPRSNVPSPSVIPTGNGGSHWQRIPGVSQSPHRNVGPAQSPIRSSSYTSSSSGQGNYASPMRFASTFEDDESSEPYDERYMPPGTARGRPYAQEISRSRSHSLATTTTRAGTIGSPFQGSGMVTPTMNSWKEPSAFPQNIPGRYGDIKPPGSRYGTSVNGRSPISSNIGIGYSNNRQIDSSNMSPFVRDVGAILNDGSAFRELWAMNPPRDENGGGGSGATSRRHSVSVVQPRRGGPIVGFNAPEDDFPEETYVPSASAYGGRGGLMLSDDDLAGDLNLNMLNLSMNGGPSVSQPSSLPIYAPRSPPVRDRLSPYQPMAGAYGRQPSDGGNSPTADPHSYFQSQAQQQPLTARFIPGQGIQYVRARAHSYSGRAPQQQQGFYPRDGTPQQQTLNELGKGLPLHAVPPSWPLFIVEFKAARTDLFYLTDLSQDIRVGDLVLVEADRGKDLGKVVNDSITLAEVEEFQRQQTIRAGLNGGGDGAPTSPGGTPLPAGKKEIAPKQIYGKAQGQEAQMLIQKMQDEVKALQLCQSKVRQKKLPMEVIDAEYQWDRRKLTFYFVAEKRIDFRELVKELFRLYKTRIWMASLGGSGFDQQ